MSIKFWERRISGDTARHRSRGVGPATDFVGSMGDPIHAPFAGSISYTWFGNGPGGAGWRVEIKGTRYTFQGAHLMGNEGNGWDKKRGTAPKNRKRGAVLWRSVVGAMGYTGDTDGVHIHAVIYDRKTGKRYSFAEWLIMRKGRKNVPALMRLAINNGIVKPVS